ncbi:MAG: RNA-binding protein [Crocinitomicaceae bacterium]|nr:RNA-binding protein [Crocinitomicaceae bacterium]|tara:strand:+ start:324 stop:767 length:444 start_codon:yes stop_codon:yes gene_type:complete
MSENNNDNRDREELYSVRVRAGKRTYFFDVKETRGKDLYMTITESKRNFDNSGNVNYSKHKLFLYREDFEKFEDGFIDATDKIKELMNTGEFRDPIAERKANDSETQKEEKSEESPASEDSVSSDSKTQETNKETDSSDDEVNFEDL